MSNYFMAQSSQCAETKEEEGQQRASSITANALKLTSKSDRLHKHKHKHKIPINYTLKTGIESAMKTNSIVIENTEINRKQSSYLGSNEVANDYNQKIEDYRDLEMS